MMVSITLIKRSGRVELRPFLLTLYFAWTAVSLTPSITNIVRPHLYTTTKRSLCLFAGNKKKNLSSSERERRDEENRRRQRQDDVIIGKTSAKKGEKDYALDPKATEEQWLRQASKVEQKIFKLTDAGMEFLNSVSTDCFGSQLPQFQFPQKLNKIFFILDSSSID